ncbi:tryptophan halogenase [Asticcacaulis benevestitus DSM 16100 = ATCC BAA-896]|uniref:Tryptophan halogenase n=2 Tax=Asticcacaulis TaxID=76890 RepID=V4PBA9_9CAUL|nr:tryptophan halogenase family protein [Asticcacaulis benevestitus]ESQ91152.1 tryptophan halogenase [Asticcacaulis benevestitus DSM 16100 = ATCC BAA-896]
MGKAGIRNLVIVGGGTAGWMAAAALSKVFGTQSYAITLIESDEIGTVGVGEATIPTIQEFNTLLEIDENQFMKETNASFKLGIRFLNWKHEGSDYFHPFGTYGVDMNVNFTHYWMRYHLAGGSGDFGLFNPQTLASRLNRFGRMAEINPKAPKVNYAFHFDASLYAKFLRRHSEARGVVRHEGKITSVVQHPDDGDITCVALESGKTIEGDLFIDCSGFRGLLIEQTLKTGYEDWSQWLPCNRAVAVPCDKVSGLTPYTTSTAREAGWQWRIPLQHRTGNGYVFCDSYLSEDQAMDLILQRLDGRPQADPRVIRFTTGHRKKQWNRNVIAMGLASGFLEPLESTSIYLVQEAIMKLLRYFPRDQITESARSSFNRDMLFAYDDVKDFLIAHYKVTERAETPFWAYCKHMDVPDSLRARLESFERHNQSLVKADELFKEASWFAVLAGQGLMPKSYHPIADLIAEDEFRWRMDRVKEGTAGLANAMPGHEAYIAKACPSLATGKA